LFASRDRFGVKPFYYFRSNETFIFSSEIKAILKVKKINEANHGKVFDYLAYGYKTSNGDTFFKDINELKPAHNIVIQNTKVNIEKYWDFKKTESDEREIENKVKFLLYDSVKLRFRSDVPVAILLSGGLDSSIIARITDELIETNKINQDEVTAYSAVFPGFKYDESDLIKEFLKTCKHIKSVEIIPDNQDLINTIHTFVYGMGEPVFSPTSYAHYALMKQIKKENVKTVLNGQGADESWCGYDKNIIGYFLLDLLLSKPLEFLTQMSAFKEKKKYSHKFILAQLLKAIFSRKYASFFRSKYSEKIYECLSDEFCKSNYNYFRNPNYKKLSSNNLNGYLKFNIQNQGFNQILHYEDHSSMLNSIEMRSPFIDYRLMEFAFSIPSERKLYYGTTKKILRELFKEKLPGSIVNNPEKIGFVTPFENRLEQHNMKEFVNDLLNSDSFNKKTIFDSKKIKNTFKDRKHFPNFPYWRIINLEIWSQVYGITNL
ncbi:MAG: asparagine synthase-related protein, partial [bacterium]